MQWNIENIVIIVIKPLEMHQILALNNPKGVDISLNNQTKQNCTSW